MKLKRRTSARRPSLPTALRRRWLKRLLGATAVLMMLAGATLWGVYQGMFLYKTKSAQSLADVIDHVAHTRLQIVPNLVSGYLADPPERLVLDIKHKHFQKLAYKREVALRQGLLLSSGDDYVPAEIRQAERTVRVKLRLKGDWVDHVAGDKWSYRVKVRGDDAIHGMKVFSLHHPGTRRFIHEWLYHQVLQREGIVPLRYRFVAVTVNGKDHGVYALEEHFDKRVIEHNDRREGPILKFNEDLHWIDIGATGHRGSTSTTGIRGMRAGTIDGFRLASTREDPEKWSLFLAGATLLEDFRRGDLRSSEVFDVRKLARYFALLDLLGAEHSASWINLRFYYNPITARLEPVGFDGNAGAPLRHPIGSSVSLAQGERSFERIAFADPELFAAYVEELERVSRPEYLDVLFSDLREELMANLRVLHREFPYLYFDEGLYYGNQRTIRSMLQPAKGLHAYLERAAPGDLILELANLGALPLEVVGARWAEGALEPAEPTILPPTAFTEAVDYQKTRFPTQADTLWSEEQLASVQVVYRTLGSSDLRSETVFPRSRRIPGELSEAPVRRSPNFESFDFLRADPETRTLTLLPGNWIVASDLILPAGYRVQAGPGTHLDLREGAMILSYSPLHLRGSPDAEIVIESSDGTGQGLVVLEAKEQSSLRHVVFRNLRNPARKGWTLTGAVTFYESPVEIEDTEFLENNSEDGLNIVRSDFEIKRSLFAKTPFDAFDADFADGSISESSFLGIGNDAIDVSGSQVRVSRVRVSGVGDKGLSAGERAELTLSKIDVRDASIGVASKDDSTVVADHVAIHETKVGYAIYRKKPEFGPASMQVRHSSLFGVATPHLVETGSQLELDGRRVDPTGDGVFDTLYSRG